MQRYLHVMALIVSGTMVDIMRWTRVELPDEG